MVRERGPQVKKIDLKIANKDSENYKYALEMCNCTNAHFYFRSTFDLRWKTNVRRLESRDMKLHVYIDYERNVQLYIFTFLWDLIH